MLWSLLWIIRKCTKSVVEIRSYWWTSSSPASCRWSNSSHRIVSSNSRSLLNCFFNVFFNLWCTISVFFLSYTLKTWKYFTIWNSNWYASFLKSLLIFLILFLTQWAWLKFHLCIIFIKFFWWDELLGLFLRWELNRLMSILRVRWRELTLYWFYFHWLSLVMLFSFVLRWFCLNFLLNCNDVFILLC